MRITALMTTILALVAAPLAQADSQLVANLKAGKSQKIVTYGTSLTAGGAWVGHLQKALDASYPGLATIVNSGGSGQYSQWGVANLDARVLKHAPDLVTIEFAVNDAVTRFHCPLAQAKANLEDMVTRLQKARPACEIILITTTPADQHPVGHFSHREDIAPYYEMYRQVAKERKLSVVDLHPQWLELRKADPKTFARLVPDAIHATPEGCQRIVSPGILKALGLMAAPATLPATPATPVAADQPRP